VESQTNKQTAKRTNGQTAKRTNGKTNKTIHSVFSIQAKCQAVYILHVWTLCWILKICI